MTFLKKTTKNRQTDLNLEVNSQCCDFFICYVSPAVCEENIRLMFTVLERSALPVVRANAIIALGDLTVRFPNTLEPWTQNLYAR